MYLTFNCLDLCFLFHGCCNIKYTGYVMTSHIKDIVLKADNKYTFSILKIEINILLK